MRRLALIALPLLTCVVAVARAASPDGEFAEGEARLLSSDARGVVLAVRFERCGPYVRSEWRAQDGSLLVVRNGKRARIEITSGDERRVREVDAPVDLTLGPMLALRAERNLGDLRRGKPFVIDYLVPDRFIVLRFSMAAPSRAPGDVQVSPTSWLVRQTLEPMRFFFDAQGTFVGLRGRALPLAGTPQRKEPMPLELRLDHRFRAECVPKPASRPPMLAWAE